jgi:thiamine monophosphate synthase
LETAAEVIAAGATAPAVISAIVAAPDIAAAASAFRARVVEAKGLERSRRGPHKGPRIA